MGEEEQKKEEVISSSNHVAIEVEVPETHHQIGQGLSPCMHAPLLFSDPLF